MSKSTHLILKKLVLNDFHLKVASWDKIQKLLFQEGRVKKEGEGLYQQLNDLKKVEGNNYRLKVTRLAKEVFP